MALDPRTPVLVGVGQVTNRPDPAQPPAERPGPVDLMAQAVGAAAEDVDGSAPGGAAPAGRRLLERAQRLAVVAMLGTPLPNPGLVVARRLGLDPAEIVLSAIGGNMPQSLMNAGALAIARGDIEAMVVTGAEGVSTRVAARKDPAGTAGLGWVTQDRASTPAPIRFGVERDGATAFEASRGVTLPVIVYPLFENALRAANGWSLAEQRTRIGALWSSLSTVAVTNPFAWMPDFKTPEEITEPGPANRMVSFPYTKLCTANIQVDQGAAWILCSLEAARAAGAPEERWVFPLAGAEANDHWFVSERAELHASPGIGLAGRAALDMAGVDLDDLGPIDLYSCFPSAVRMAADALGLPLDDPGRPLSVTGGLTFAGGPGNNYVSHAIASVTDRLRRAPGSVGLVTGLGWYATKHALGLYGTAPPVGGFAWRNVQDEVDALARTTPDESVSGSVTVETYSVPYDRDGQPERAVVACRTPSGARSWGTVTDPDDLGVLVSEEAIGRPATLSVEGVVSLT